MRPRRVVGQSEMGNPVLQAIWRVGRYAAVFVATKSLTLPKVPDLGHRELLFRLARRHAGRDLGSTIGSC